MTPNASPANQIRFFLEKREVTVNTDGLSPDTSLNEYLRDKLALTGTKKMCFEGGCGACIVVVERQDPITLQPTYQAVNSCLVSVLSCDNWIIHTVESIGNPLDGYHPTQEVLAKFNGTQCGFCSPGMVMNMYALYESEKLTMQEVEDSFGGNICRCTGYRPILSAFKSLCDDADTKLLGTVADIEEIKACCGRGGGCGGQRQVSVSLPKAVPRAIQLADSRWIKVTTFQELLDTLASVQNSNYRLVAGNTAKGVDSAYRGPFDVYIDVSDVDELRASRVTAAGVQLGANITLTKMMELFNRISVSNPGLAYLKKLGDHLDLVASVPVRNFGTLAGNLMLKNANNAFSSDIFLMLETVGATVTITDLQGVDTTISLLDFITTDMNLKVLRTINVPMLTETDHYESYKIMPRAQDSLAIVNAGFLFKLDASGVVQSARIVYGNINPTFTHATATEALLEGRNLFDNQTIQSAIQSLTAEIVPNVVPADASPDVRKKLAISLFYKTVLALAPQNRLSSRNVSGGAKLVRPVSSGVQDYQTHESLYPLTQAIPKMEALAQTSGQAEYVNDQPDLPRQLYAAFVLAPAPANSTITSIDPTRALAVEGVVAFYGADDIPGINSCVPTQMFPFAEELFAKDKVAFYNQPVGIVVGESESVLRTASRLVDITFNKSTAKALTSVRQVLDAGEVSRIRESRSITASQTGNDVQHVVKGNFDIYQQYHYHLETQSCNVVPSEDGLEVYPTTQWMDLVQLGISQVINIPNNKIKISVRRCGGGYGGKITRNNQTACAAALAAWKLRRPVKMNMSLGTNMNVVGKRFPLTVDYEVGVNNSGVIQYLNASLYSDVGVGENENSIFSIVDLFTANYNNRSFTLHFYTAHTDTYPNTFARSPGTCEGLAAIEAIMEHVAHEAKLDPLQFRMTNANSQNEVGNYLRDIREWAELDSRRTEIDQFNRDNRWKKRGLAVVPMAYGFSVSGPYTANVTIYHGDGSVVISHGGIEVGQGIHTKAAQVCAYKFGIPLEKISVIPSINYISPNNTATGGSATSEGVCYGVIQACDELLSRMEQYRASAPTWEQLVATCFRANVPLTASGMYSRNARDLGPYTIYGSCAVEVEVDILTGQYNISRVDLLEDCGQSSSPLIDIGQVEGAFVMGMGYHTTEEIIYDDEGKLLTNNTWTYRPPGPRDIPIDFRIQLAKNKENPVGVLKSKAIAEPPLCMTIAVPLAIRNALGSARTDANSNNPTWYPIAGPTTVANVISNTLSEYSQYIL